MGVEEKIVYASAKPTGELLGAFQRAQALEPSGLSYAAIFERAEHYFVENQNLIDIPNLLNAPKAVPLYDGELPSSFKVRINDLELDRETNAVIAQKFSITRVMTPFKMRLVLTAYIFYLEGRAQEIAAPDVASDLYKRKLEVLAAVMKIQDQETLEKVWEAVKEIG